MVKRRCQSWERLILTGENNDKGFVEDNTFELDVEGWVKWTDRMEKFRQRLLWGKARLWGKHTYGSDQSIVTRVLGWSGGTGHVVLGWFILWSKFS